MEGKMVAPEGEEWRAGDREDCEKGSRSGGSLTVLNEVQRAYEERLAVIDRIGGAKKLQMQVEALRSWVSDLVGQNTLLVRAISELEQKATSRLSIQRTRYAEMELELRTEVAALRRRLARKESDIRALIEVLRRLREFDYFSLEGIHFFEVKESDIFGTVNWPQKNLDHGDSDPKKKHTPPHSRKNWFIENFRNTSN